MPPPYPPPPPGSQFRPQSPPPAIRRTRRWPAVVAAAAVGALTAAVTAAVITVRVQDPVESAQRAQPAVTETVDAPAPAPPAKLPTAQADRRTCEQGWIPAGSLIDDAQAELAKTPPGVAVDDPAVVANPEWAAAVTRAGELYRQAGTTLAGNIAPGTTPVLSEAAATAVRALRLLGDTISARDPINGNAGEISNAAAAQVGTLCQRLAPR